MLYVVLALQLVVVLVYFYTFNTYQRDPLRVAFSSQLFTEYHFSFPLIVMASTYLIIGCVTMLWISSSLAMWSTMGAVGKSCALPVCVRPIYLFCTLPCPSQFVCFSLPLSLLYISLPSAQTHMKSTPLFCYQSLVHFLAATFLLAP